MTVDRRFCSPLGTVSHVTLKGVAVSHILPCSLHLFQYLMSKVSRAKPLPHIKDCRGVVFQLEGLVSRAVPHCFSSRRDELVVIDRSLSTRCQVSCALVYHCPHCPCKTVKEIGTLCHFKAICLHFFVYCRMC